MASSTKLQVKNLDAHDLFPAWSDSQWDELSTSSHMIFMYMTKDVIDVFALFGHHSEDPVVHLLKLVVLPQKRRQRLATQLMQEAVSFWGTKKKSAIYLEVEETNLKAINCYDRLGFEKLHLKKHFYGQERNAWSMQLRLGLH
jgi:ribosomal-protein-alanine N-acetyltransferase